MLIVGGGIGGLSAAIHLASKGLPVTLFESRGKPGGKLRQVPAEDSLADAGPTVFTLREVFEALFAAGGTSLASELSLTRATLLARHAWNDNRYLDLFADIDASADAIGQFAGAAAARGYLDFCQESEQVYRVLAERFINAQRPSPLSLALSGGLSGMLEMAQIKPFSTLWQALGKHFADPRLRQLFARYSTYVGSSPFLSPATLMLIAHVEQMGVWYLKGGMYALCEALMRTAERNGVEVRCGQRVDEIVVDRNGVCGVRLEHGEEVRGQAVIFNGDTSALAEGLMGEAVVAAGNSVAPKDRSLSAQTWVMQASIEGFPLAHHTVFFGPDYKSEFEDLFTYQRLPAQPTVYVCAQDRDDEGKAPIATSERLLILVNAAARGDHHPPDAKEIRRCRSTVFHRLRQCGLTLTPRGQETVTGPAEFSAMFPGSGGALYGRASHGWMASFRRPGARTKIPRLYLAGGSAHPGAGVPMAAISGRLAAESLECDLGLISESKRTVTYGGTSMASATTGSTASQ